jgi:hypothetical protein
MRIDGLWASTQLESKFKRGNLPIEQLCELISIRSTIIIVTVINTPSCFDTRTIILSFSDGSSWAKYKVVQIWPGLIVCKQVTVCPGHIWTTLYLNRSTRQACPTTARIAPPLSSLKESFAFADIGVLRSLRDVLAVCTHTTHWAICCLTVKTDKSRSVQSQPQHQMTSNGSYSRQRQLTLEDRTDNSILHVRGATFYFKNANCSCAQHWPKSIHTHTLKTLICDFDILCTVHVNSM